MTYPFFSENLPFSNKRYRHYDLVTKFLRWSEADGPTDVAKINPDEWWLDYVKGRCTIGADYRLGVRQVLTPWRTHSSVVTGFWEALLLSPRVSCISWNGYARPYNYQAALSSSCSISAPSGTV